ncbi:FtsW/RodA/SpoVE family cell cycle protein [Anaerosinus massiliensis]|uniref:FtsW/RodA/SpoVE family cell cycle protein n=1 Tax=Massilibacillus massiliensis TaxID=1806837 RepID=UPI000DA5F3F0|nr:FtsW/RodA/SpoVE family cell cycle protein [Massilibacillus massiliensis]
MSNLRENELQLLIIACFIFLFGISIVQLQNLNNLKLFILVEELGFIIACFIIQKLLRVYFPNSDPFLFPSVITLISIGLTMIYRLKPLLFQQQLKWIFIGLFIFSISAFIFRKIHLIFHYKYIIGLIGIGLLLLSILLGTDINGSRSWIIMGPIRFQPSEFAKIFIIIFLATYLIENKVVLGLKNNKFGPIVLPSFRFIAPFITIWSLAMLMFLLQKDLGSALLFFGIAILMTYMANNNLSYIFIAGSFFVIGSTLSYFLFDHVKVRVNIWNNPWADPNGQAYQIVQSLFAITSGGILGTGITYGHPEFIPEVHTDFIFSAIAEELGFVGAIFIILLYVLIIYRGFKISLMCKNEINALIAAGISVSIALQIFIIIAGVTKFLPLTGITLPFLSYGGSSMVSSFIMVGLLFALSEKRNNIA